MSTAKAEEQRYFVQKDASLPDAHYKHRRWVRVSPVSVRSEAVATLAKLQEAAPGVAFRLQTVPTRAMLAAVSRFPIAPSVGVEAPAPGTLVRVKHSASQLYHHSFHGKTGLVTSSRETTSGAIRVVVQFHGAERAGDFRVEHLERVE
jgi:hypothetical protein